MNPKYKEDDLVRSKSKEIWQILRVAQPGDAIYNRLGDNHPRYYVAPQGDIEHYVSWYYNLGPSPSYLREDEILDLLIDPCRCHPKLPWTAENCLDCILKYYP
jgi:hypothetical protein